MLRQRAMDLRTFNRDMLAQLGVQVPPEIQQWGRLKQWVIQSQNSLSKDTLNKINQLQHQYFAGRQDELNAAIMELKQQINIQRQHQQQASSGATPNVGRVNGQAPPAQMVPRAQAPQPGLGQQILNAQQGPNQVHGGRMLQPPREPTLEEARAVRQRLDTTFAGTDEEFRQAYWHKIRTDYAQNFTRMQQQEALRNAQAQRLSQNIINGQAAGGPSRQIQNIAQSTVQHIKGQKRSAQPTNSGGDDVVEIPDPNAPASRQPLPPPIQTQQQQQKQEQQQGQQMATALMMANKGQHLQGTPFFANMSPANQEKVLNMSEEERKKLHLVMKEQRKTREDALRKVQMGITNPQQMAGQYKQQQQVPVPLLQQRQQGPGLPSQALQGGDRNKPLGQERVQAILLEVQQENPKGRPVHIDELGRRTAIARLQQLSQGLDKIALTWVVAPAYLEQKVRATIKARVQVSQNWDSKAGTIKNFLSLTPSQLNEHQQAMQSYIADLKQFKGAQGVPVHANENMQQQQQLLQQSSQPQANARSASAAGKAPQQAQSLGRTPSQQGHNRRASSSKAPPAPTENKSFDWVTTRPDGVPKYDSGRTELTPDKLKMPPNKKRRTGQADSQDSTPLGQVGTPVAGTGSPSVGNKVAPSPEQGIRKSAQPMKQEAGDLERDELQKLRFKCREPLCEASIKGFESEEELRKHAEAHHRPVKDPLEFLLDSAASALGVDVDDQILDPVTKMGNTAIATQAKPAVAKKQTPAAIKQEVATPIGKSLNTSSTVPAAKEKTLREEIEEKMGIKSTCDAGPSAVSSGPPGHLASVSDDDPFGFAELLQTTLAGADDSFDFAGSLTGGVTNDWSILPQADPLLDSSPELTPSDGTASHASSDISQSERLRINLTWDPFGNGDTQVPETLGALAGMGLGGKDGAGSIIDDGNMAL
ncbi:MAG: hypothetical protein FE78DRAFT_253561 [Acidomyces sp. 'richmondensis']|nr:MAG: hypothetical protein FE78DRAFT_253561 [Acidomyces sp. 'richmondensis']